ncbi:MAG TPA: thioredoxin domain-containing protein, partial [Myxococcota bacterium]|nr:thioredoxin domain-containing protein [Myxococcota bacterium]
YELPAGTVRYEPNDPVKGNPEAKFILVEWADFQCPHCAAMFPELKKVIEENPDVKLYYKHYPISQTCNHFVEWEGHKDSCRAAAASVCANAQNAFWPLAEKMFKNQEYLGKDDLRFMVQQAGLDSVAFEACMADPATEAAVREDVEAGGLAQINGTPSIFLKGPFGDQWVKINGGHEEINAVLAAARAGQPLPPPPPPSAGR